MLELLSPRKTQDNPYRKRLDEAGIKGGWNYALDHAWLFENVDKYMKANPDRKFPVILDVGCGNSMLHTFMEQELHVGIIGVDRVFGHCPFDARDPRMDLCINFAEDNTFFKENVDIIYWCSSIEHNEPELQIKCVKESLKALKPGGMFLATFGYAPKSGYFEPSQQFNLSKEDAERVFGQKWAEEPNFDKMVAEYREDAFQIDTKHNKRYGKTEYDFIVGAAKIIK